MNDELEAGYRDDVETVTVVGGGDAGTMTALVLRQLNPELGITVVDDFEEDVPQVGKSTITYILYTFHDFLEIDLTRFINEVKPVWKASVHFRDWGGRGPFHVPFDGFTLQPQAPGSQRFEVLYERYRTKNYHTLGTELAERGVSPAIRENYYQRQAGNLSLYDQVAYHLGTDRLNGFLRELCDERGVELVDDQITDVRTDDDRIERIASEGREYEADLYVDATGFDRVLMSELDNEFREFDFPLDSALVAQTDLALSDIEPATVINSGDNGWFWQIDTYDCRDLGYVYSSAHASDAEAIAEFVEKKDDISEDDVRKYEFQAGRHERAWVTNCIAVGNALGFVEPLQSTALTLNAKLTEKLSELLADHHRINHAGVREIYNGHAESIWNNTYDFVSAHYRFAPGTNDFWESMRSVNDRDRFKRYVENYRKNGFNSFEEFDGENGPGLAIFNQYLFYQLFSDLGVESDFYESLDLEVSEGIRENIQRNDDRIAKRMEYHLPYEEVYDEIERSG